MLWRRAPRKVTADKRLFSEFQNMAGDNASSITQSSSLGTATLSNSTAISSRQFVDSHLDSSRSANSITQDSSSVSITTDKNQKAILVDQALRQQSTVRLKQEQLQEFSRQEKETNEKSSEAKSLVKGTQERIAALEAHYQEYKDSWKFWRALTSEKDTILQGLAREKELLKSQEEKVKEFEKRQEQYKKTKEEYLAAVDKPQASSRENSQHRERLLAQLRVQSASLDNLMVLDLLAVRRYQYSQEHDRPLNAWQKFKSSAYETLKDNAAGRLLIGVATIGGKVVGAVSDAVVGAATFIFDGKTWGKAWDGIKWGFGKLKDGVEWVGSTIVKGVSAAWNFASKWENWANLGSSIMSGLSKTWNFITTADNWKKGWENLKWGVSKVVDGACWLGSKLKDGAVAVYNFASKWENWQKLGSSIVSGISKAYDFVTSPENWKKLGSALYSGLSFIGGILSNPRKILNAIGEVLSIAGQFLVDPNAAWDKLCNSVDKFMTKLTDSFGVGFLWKGAKAVLGFVKDLSDSLGITSIIAGAANLMTMPTRLLYQACKAGYSVLKELYNFTVGKTSFEQMSQGLSNATNAFVNNMRDGLVQSSRLVTGAYRLVIECTGLADFGRGIACALKGDWSSAKLYFALGAMNLGCLALTIGSGGAGAAMYAFRQTLQKAALALGKKGFIALGREIGEAVANKLVKKVGFSFFEKQAVACADNLVKHCAEKGLALDTIEAMAKSVAKQDMKRALEKSGLPKIIYSHTRKALQQVVENPKKAIKALSKMEGIAGKAEAKKIVHYAGKMLRSGKKLDEVASAMSKEIADKVYNKIGPKMEEAFANRFRDSLSGKVASKPAMKLAAQIEKEAAEAGIPKTELIEKYVLKARTGFRQGLQEALYEVAEAAVRKAIKRLKIPHEDKLPRLGLFGSVSTYREHRKEEKKLNVLKAEGAKLEKHDDVAKKEAEAPKSHMRLLKSEVVVVNGKHILNSLEQIDDGKWKVISSAEIDEKVAAEIEAGRKSEKVTNALDAKRKEDKAA